MHKPDYDVQSPDAETPNTQKGGHVEHKESKQVKEPVPHTAPYTADISAIASVLAAYASDPELAETIYYFITQSHRLAKWSQRTNIASARLLLRWVQMGQSLTVENWRKRCFTALVITHKVTDETPLSNRALCIMWNRVISLKGSRQREISPKSIPLAEEELNRLETRMMTELENQVFLSCGTMADFYNVLMNGDEAYRLPFKLLTTLPKYWRVSRPRK
jgi:hypothetical protein